MTLYSQNAALHFDAFFLIIARYWKRARDHTLGWSMQEMWWCGLVHVHALHMHYTIYTAARVILHTEVSSNQPYFAVWVVAANQSF